VVLFLTSGCAYFNTFYHAKKYYGQAVRAQERGVLGTGSATAASGQMQGNLSGQIPGNLPGQNPGQSGQLPGQVGSQPPSGNQAADELFRKCIEKCEKILEKHRGSKWADDAQLLMAQSYYGRGDHLTAAGEFQAFTEMFPESDKLPDAIYWQGLTAFALERYSDARAYWSDLLDRFPKDDRSEEAEFYVARTAWREEQIPEAITAYESFLERHKGGEFRSTAQLDLAKILRDEKRYEDAAALSRRVIENASRDDERLEAKLLLGEVLEAQSSYGDALEIYREVALDLDSNVMEGRLSPEERRARWEEEALRLAQAQADSLNPQPPGGLQPGQVPPPGTLGNLPPGTAGAAAGTAAPQRQRLPANDPRYAQLAQVLLREGQALAKTDRAWEAVTVFQQVVEEYPRTAYAAEAQFRIGYTYELLLEDLDAAEHAYAQVAGHGRSSSFTDLAERRSRNLATLKTITASGDSARAEMKAAEARFLRAELYLFQQEKPERALEEYAAIEAEFPGTEAAAKAALAQAWVLFHVQGDTARGRERYAEVAAAYPGSEYGHEARRVVEGEEAAPLPGDFAGPSLEELLDPENLAAIAAADTLPAGVEGPELADAAAESMAAPVAQAATPEAMAEERRLAAGRRRAAGNGASGLPGAAVAGGVVAAGAGATPGTGGPGPEAAGVPPPEPAGVPPPEPAETALPEPIDSAAEHAETVPPPAGTAPSAQAERANSGPAAAAAGAAGAAAALASDVEVPGPDAGAAGPDAGVAGPDAGAAGLGEATPSGETAMAPQHATVPSPDAIPLAAIPAPPVSTAPRESPPVSRRPDGPDPLQVPQDGPARVGVDAPAVRVPGAARALDPMAIPDDGWTPVLPPRGQKPRARGGR
jgi:TolA-binding protein